VGERGKGVGCITAFSAGTKFEVHEKVDGSLGVLFHVPLNYAVLDRKELGGWVINTRGSWQSPQCQEASRMLDAYNLATLDPAYTYCVEIVYPENRIVVQYRDRKDLTLLAAVHTVTGTELPTDVLRGLASAAGFRMPAHFGEGIAPPTGAGVTPSDSDAVDGSQELSAYIKATFAARNADTMKGDEAEGFVLVAEPASGGERMRLKWKYEAYMALHRSYSVRVTDVMVWEALAKGNGTDGLAPLLDAIPDECHDEVMAVARTLQAAWAEAKKQVSIILDDLKRERRDCTRKQAAAFFKHAGALRPPLFAAFTSGDIDDPDTAEQLWKCVKPNKATAIEKRAGSGVTPADSASG
jgi:RNA ligase